VTFVADFAVQGLLCGVLQVVIQKLSESDSAKTGLLEKADSIMQALLGVFQCDTTSVHEEAMLAVGALTYACGQSFTKYMQSFYPVLELGLKIHRVGLLSPTAKTCRTLFNVHVCVLSDAASYNLGISARTGGWRSPWQAVFLKLHSLEMQDAMTVLQRSSDVERQLLLAGSGCVHSFSGCAWGYLQSHGHPGCRVQ